MFIEVVMIDDVRHHYGQLQQFPGTSETAVSDLLVGVVICVALDLANLWVPTGMWYCSDCWEPTCQSLKTTIDLSES